MTKEKALAKIKKLEKYIKELDNKVGFEDDELFLLSVEEYEKYKDIIPKFNCWWWLRSSGGIQNHSAYVINDGSVSYYGLYVNNAVACVRPALKTQTFSLPIGTRISKYYFPWIVIDKNLLIAEVPIATHRFDEKSNNYENSEIRQFLMDWLKERSKS